MKQIYLGMFDQMAQSTLFVLGRFSSIRLAPAVELLLSSLMTREERWTNTTGSALLRSVRRNCLWHDLVKLWKITNVEIFASDFY